MSFVVDKSDHAHAAAVARLLRGYHLARMTDRNDDTTSLELREQQAIRANQEARAAREADQPAEARAHRRRSEKAVYLRDKLAEADAADHDAG
ncbi:MAG TPA: hypothetical protein VGM33_02240 [Baekduia sp.]